MPPKRIRLASAIALVVSLVAGVGVWSLTTAGTAASPWTVRINAASSSNYVDKAGNTWLSDRYNVGGQSFGWAQEISDTNDDPLYSKHRWGMSGYDIPVPRSAKYRVDLHFAEITFDQTGKRVFDVSAEGQKFVSALDVVDEAGPRRAIVESFEVTVSDGRLDLDFGRIIEDPFISGIKVEDISTTSTTTPPASAGFVKRISAASTTAYTSKSGEKWLADQNYNGGEVWTGGSGSTVAGTTDPALYQKHRWGMRAYAIPVPNGDYDVTLHFAENVFRQPGQRVFNVRGESRIRLRDVDVVKEAGFGKALEKSFRMTVNDGRLNVRFESVVEDPMVSAIEVIGVGGSGGGGRGSTTTAAPTTQAPTTTKAPTTTAAPPTTTAPPPVVGGSRCPAYPAFPDAGCTGVIPGTALKTCDGNITSSNVTFDKCRFPGGLYLNQGVRNITITNSLIDGTVAGTIEDHNLKLTDVEINGGGGSTYAGAGTGVTCIRCNIHHVGQGFYGSNMSLIDSYIHDLWGEGRCEPCTHNEAVLVYGGNVTISHSNLEGLYAPNSPGGGMSASVAMYTHGDFWPNLDNVVLEKSRIVSVGVYCLYAGHSNGPSGDQPGNIRITDNVFGGPCSPVVGWYPGNGNVWSNNRTESGAQISAGNSPYG